MSFVHLNLYGKLADKLKKMKVRNKAVMRKYFFSCCAFICKQVQHFTVEQFYHQKSLLSIIILTFSQRQSPASHVLQKITSCSPYSPYDKQQELVKTPVVAYTRYLVQEQPQPGPELYLRFVQNNCNILPILLRNFSSSTQYRCKRF